MSSKPLQAGKVRHHIDRIYRTQSTAYVWARELLVNAGEAGATRAWFGIEPQGVARRGVFRRVVIDDGCGMTADELVEFFSGWGVGSKEIGGDHDNMGIGAKTMTLPWNPAGVIVLSKTRGMDEPAMVWLHLDPDIDDYGLKEFTVVDDAGEVLDPVVSAYFDEELGVDFSQLLPDWAQEHGTAVLLVGDRTAAHTVLGAVSDGETSLTGLGRYLNQRFDAMPYDLDVTVEHVVGDSTDEWRARARTGDHVHSRTAHGHRHYTHPQRNGEPEPVGGAVELQDGTVAEWLLRPTEEPASVGSLSPVKRGTVTIGYERPDGSGRELFDRTTNQAVYRAMAISAPEVCKRLYVTFVPPRAGEGPGGRGALMETSRASLRWIAADGARGPLPTGDWYAEFATRMPEPIIAALDEARSSGEVDISRADVERLEALFKSRWRVEVSRPDPTGTDAAEQTTSQGHESSPSSQQGGASSSSERRPRPAGPQPARRRPGRGGVPDGEAARLADFNAEEHHLACFIAPSAARPAGLVQVNVDHPVIRSEVSHWSGQYPAHLHSEIEQAVHRVYVTQAVAAVAHVESLRGPLKLTSSVTELWRSPDGLTTSLLGLWGLERRITGALQSLGTRRQSHA